MTGRDCEREGGGGSEKGVDGFEVDGDELGDVFDEFMVAEVRRVAWGAAVVGTEGYSKVAHVWSEASLINSEFAPLTTGVDIRGGGGVRAGINESAVTPVAGFSSKGGIDFASSNVSKKDNISLFAADWVDCAGRRGGCGNGDGLRGGGGSGGGKAARTEGALILVLRLFRSALWLISLMLFVGTTARNSRSSADKDSDSFDGDVVDRPDKRPIKRDTTDGVADSLWVSSTDGPLSGGSDPGVTSTFGLTGVTGDTTTDDTGVDRPTAWLCAVLDRELLVLGRGDAFILADDIPDVLGGETEPFVVLSTVVFLPKNENRPPDFFFASSISGAPSLWVSTGFQPAGVISSGAKVGLALIEASHEVEPFDATYIAKGLDFVDEEYLVSLRASNNFLDVNVFEKGTVGGKKKSSGTSFWKIGALHQETSSEVMCKQRNLQLTNQVTQNPRPEYHPLS
jgi:hypothetical protein